ncbi:uncharacterized protein LOC114531606 [Dendronephthya gigantea]|uniref:uncharacterized protein LOC114531606 n=1 Tax=Dendronephthya gigantea TaxID=151771 RepID=UPI001069D9FA|nr:uncharacterized protein LOC114531606 [Dendronephthya gigantea]XP_028409019.1 uncharacterized protein LOC114531606 [Dendronephthya gigantea]
MKTLSCIAVLSLISIAWTNENPRTDDVHLPWFHDAVNYWDFDTAVNHTILDLKGGGRSMIEGNYNVIPGPKGNALEFLQTSKSSKSHVKLGDFSQTCLPNPARCKNGFTVSFWVNLKKVLNDGVLLQLGLSRKSRGITVNTLYRDGRIFLIFHGNTPRNAFSIKAELSPHIWHHIALVWNVTAKPKMSLFVNCSRGSDFMFGTKKSDKKKGEDKLLILGANHGGKKATPIAVDDFAIWYKTLGRERICQMINQERVHGNYSSWSGFSSCSVTCGNGIRNRTRVCDSPVPDYGGRDCSYLGPKSEVEMCNTHRCPISGGYTSWSEFSECSLFCGNGSTRYRTRNCTNPKPQYGGLDCSVIGPALHTEECNVPPCPIAGGYTSWSNFSECSLSCGNGGTRYRTRNCANPKPQYGGKDCSFIGPALQMEVCHVSPCPIAGGYTSWSNFSECSLSCGNGSTRYRTRNCTNPKPQYGGQDCSVIGPALHTEECNVSPCPITGGYTSWSEFSECSLSCGNGSTRYRTRNCTNPKPQYGGKDCSLIGPAFQIEVCHVPPCPIAGGYTSWSNFSECSLSCGNGSTRYRTRNCTNPKPQYGGQDCSVIGPALHTEECHVSSCPIAGGYTSWSNFSECSLTCGKGSTRYRTRNCTNPKPQYGGLNCSFIGPAVEIQICMINPCPVDGNYSAWSAFSLCSTSCGHGYKIRNRTCSSPVPKYDGRNCSGLGPDHEINTCNLGRCPIHGGYGDWSEFSTCSATCGNASKTRTRTCNNPSPSNGGRDCQNLGSNFETKPCETTACPIHGNYSDWSAYSPCLQSCGNSSKFRRRFCTNPEPRYGGRNCTSIGLDIEKAPCIQSSCPIHGNFSEWSEFSKCSSTCGEGSKKRYRYCTGPVPRHGGNDCSSLGPNVETVRCDLGPCPVDGNYSEWSKFTECDQTCGNGTQLRTRLCDDPAPNYGGRNCSILGPSEETRHCNPRPCPIHGNLSDWSEFSGCNKSCGSGIRIRYRYCTNPEPQHGGDNCSELGPTKDVVSCNLTPCPIHGNYSAWSSFGSCSKSCDNGTQIRRRYCTNPSPRFGGRDCKVFGSPVQSKHCETQPCPDIDFFLKFKLDNLNWTDELLDNSSRRYRDLNTELRSSVVELHAKDVIKEIKIMEYSSGSVIAAMEVIYFSRSFPGAMILYDAFYNEGRIGPYNVTPVLFTSTDVPTIAVQNLTAFNYSSTSLTLHWSRLESQQGQSEILGYSVMYEELSWTGDVKSKKIHVTVFFNTTKGRLNRLKKYSWYRIRISGMNKRGIGIPSDPLVVLTDEDVPNASPFLKPAGSNTSSTSLNIRWKAMPRADINGILRAYVLFYRPYFTNEAFHNVTVLPDQLSVHLTDLKMFTQYELCVAGVTSKGVGGISPRTLLSTNEDVPTAAPVFYNYGYGNSTSIRLQWHKVHSDHKNGVILGYHVYYKQYLSNGSWTIKTMKEYETRVTVANLKMFTKYLFRISASTTKGEGMISDSILISTDEDVPCSAPRNLTGGTTDSSTIWLKWHRLPRSCYRGILRGYTIFYRRKSRPSEWHNVTVPPTSKEVVLENLDKFRMYFFRISGYTSRGHGPVSQIVDVKTNEDVPSAWPADIRAINTSSTSIRISWNAIPYSNIHGKLRGYSTFFRGAGESEWKSKNVSENDLSSDITDLWKFTKYVFRLAGFTTVGIGVVSPEFEAWTDEDIPTRAPEQFKTINKSSATSIPLSWKPISDPFYIHGILRGYKIEYWKTYVAGEAVSSRTVVRTTGPKTLSYVLTGLEIYAVYKIKIRAVTIKGSGTAVEISAETCKCVSAYRTNWWKTSPYIYTNNSNLEGIFPAILPNMVEKCCGFCHEHDWTVTQFEGHTLDGQSYLKPGVSKFRKNIGDAIELHFPMSGQIHQVKYYKRYEFIPLVESPGVVFLVLLDDTHIASIMLLDTITNSLPIVLLMITFITLIGIITWGVESFTNNKQFPPTFFAGSHQGVWWSMVSMTTIGYGDRYPRSILGRIIGIFWILTGSIIMSFYTSVLTSQITTEVVANELKLYGTKVAVLQNSSEHQLAVRKNAYADLEHPYNNLYDIYNALSKGYVKGALIDAYVLGSQKDLFKNIGVRIKKIYDYSSAYGVVLGGEAKKLHKCFRGYVSENRKEIFRIIEGNVDMIKKTDVSNSVKRARSLIDPTFIIYKKCLFVSLVLLCFAFLFGILIEYFKKPLKRTLCHSMYKKDLMKKKLSEVLNTQASLKQEMRESCIELSDKLKALKIKHRCEIKRWVRIKKALRRKRRPSEDSLMPSHSSAVRYEEPYLSPIMQLRKLITNDQSKGGNNNHSRRVLMDETLV